MLFIICCRKVPFIRFYELEVPHSSSSRVSITLAGTSCNHQRSRYDVEARGPVHKCYEPKWQLCCKLRLATGNNTVLVGARNPTKLAAFVEQGVESVLLDSDNLESIEQAFTSVHSAYIVLPPVQIENNTLFEDLLEAAKANGVIKHIVYLSAMTSAAPDDQKFEVVHKHYKHEQLLIHSNIADTILRPTWFHESTVAYLSASIKHTGAFRSSAGDGVWTSVAICDIAAVAVATLMNPNKHAGKIYILMEEAITDVELAEKISRAIGKKVMHVNLIPDEHEQFLRENYTGLIPVEETAKVLVRLDKNKSESLFRVVAPDLEQVLGRKGVSLDEFLAENADAFKNH